MKHSEFEELLEKEISQITQSDLVDTIRIHLVTPRLEYRDWDYSEERNRYPCWIALEDVSSNTAIAYCDQGFGPSYSWGLIAIQWNLNMGMDSDWFISLEEAVRNATFWNGENPDGYEVS